MDAPQFSTNSFTHRDLPSLAARLTSGLSSHVVPPSVSTQTVSHTFLAQNREYRLARTATVHRDLIVRTLADFVVNQYLAQLRVVVGARAEDIVALEEHHLYSPTPPWSIPI